MQIQITHAASQQIPGSGDPGLKRAPQSRIGTLVAQMRGMDIFNPLLKEQLNIWSKTVSLELFDQQRSAETNQIALMQLGVLLCKVVQPAMFAEATEEAYIELFAVEDNVKDLMRGYLPPHIDVDKFIAWFKQQEVEKSLPVEEDFEPKPQATPGKRLALVLQQMQQSKMVSAEKLSEINGFAAEIPAALFDALENDDLKETASLALCYFLSNIIYPALLKAEGRDAKRELLAWEKEIKSILSCSLPTGEHVDAFIGSAEIGAAQHKLFNAKLELIESCFNTAMAELKAAANAANAKTIEAFKRMQQQLLILNQARTKTTKAASDPIEALMLKVDALIQELMQHAASGGVVAEKLQSAHHRFHQMIVEAKLMLGGCRL